jgi:hypothetical protein
MDDGQDGVARLDHIFLTVVRCDQNALLPMVCETFADGDRSCLFGQSGQGDPQPQYDRCTQRQYGQAQRQAQTGQEESQMRGALWRPSTS